MPEKKINEKSNTELGKKTPKSVKKTLQIIEKW